MQIHSCGASRGGRILKATGAGASQFQATASAASFPRLQIPGSLCKSAALHPLRFPPCLYGTSSSSFSSGQRVPYSPATTCPLVLADLGQLHGRVLWNGRKFLLTCAKTTLPLRCRAFSMFCIPVERVKHLRGAGREAGYGRPSTLLTSQLALQIDNPFLHPVGEAALMWRHSTFV